MIPNQIRAYSYLSGVLSNREKDPFCSSCTSFQATLQTVQASMDKFQQERAAEIEKLPGFSLAFAVSRGTINSIRMAGKPMPQKKAGSCTLPEGVCFLKSSLGILQKI